MIAVATSRSHKPAPKPQANHVVPTNLSPPNKPLKRHPFGMSTLVSGLSVATPYRSDLALAAIIGGAANLNDLEAVEADSDEYLV